LLTRSAPGNHDGINAWLDQHGVNAVLVRPDRYVFGSGEADRLRAAYQRYLASEDSL
jgi:3-(3-hydroxy-phenyl)propionate hydroxylase